MSEGKKYLVIAEWTSVYYTVPRRMVWKRYDTLAHARAFIEEQRRVKAFDCWIELDGARVE